MTPIIGLVDVDGPCADFDPTVFDRCVEIGHQFDIAHVGEQRHRFLTDHLPDSGHRREMRQLIEGPGWFRELPVVPGAREGLEEMIAAGWDIWLCTKPLEASATCLSEKQAWVAEHFPFMLKRLITTPDKSLVRGTFLLDDAVKLEWIPRAEWHPVVFETPWNGAGSPWEPIVHRWTWGRPLADLIEGVWVDA